MLGPLHRRSGVLHKLFSGGIHKTAEPREEVMILLSFRPHDPEFIFILLPWCRHTAVEDVTVQLPLPFLLLPNDDVLALVQHLPPFTLERER